VLIDGRWKAGALDDLKARFGGNLWIASLDVTDAIAVREVVDRVLSLSQTLSRLAVDRESDDDRVQ
jgi:hypothetical protein